MTQNNNSDRYRAIMIDGDEHLHGPEAEDAKLSIQTVAPQAGEKVNVGGIPGWYGAGAAPIKGSKAMGSQMEGDTFHTTSGAGFRVDGVDSGALSEAPGIGATEHETPCQRARRVFGGRLMDETKLIPMVRSDGAPDPFERFALVWKSDDKAIAEVGRVAAQHTKGTPMVEYDPAPTLLQPSALDILDSVPGFEVDRGGVIGGTIPWIQGRPIEAKVPNGDVIRIRPMVTNPLGGEGSFALLFPTEAVSCRNVYTGLLGARTGVFRIKHCKAGQAQLEAFQAQLAQAGEHLTKALGDLATMATARVKQDWLEEEFLPKVFKYKASEKNELSPQKANRINRWRRSYEEAIGSELATGWGVLQATSFLTTHEWAGDHDDPVGASDVQFWNGEAGATEARAVQLVRRLAFPKVKANA